MLLPARLRHGNSWSDTCILNVSSHGLMIHTGRPISRGTQVEIRRGGHIIVARVVWRDDGRAGLCSEEGVPVTDIAGPRPSPVLQVNAPEREGGRQPPPDNRRRLKAKLIEVAGVFLVATSIAVAGLAMLEEALVRPLALTLAAL